MVTALSKYGLRCHPCDIAFNFVNSNNFGHYETRKKILTAGSIKDSAKFRDNYICTPALDS